jgi:hypothetical protein
MESNPSKVITQAPVGKFGNSAVGVLEREKEPKLIILSEELKKFTGKPRSEVMAYILKTYGGQYQIPGPEYEEYLFENLGKVPKELKDYNWYYLMGSTINDEENNPCISCVYFYAGEFRRALVPLNGEWYKDDRVVLLEMEK